MAWRSLLLLALVASVTATNSQGANLCQGCRKIVSFMERLNTTIDKHVAPILQPFCEQYYPPSTDFQQGPCPVFVQGFSYVMRNINPVTHCDEINMCGPKQPSDDIYQYMESSNSIASRKPEKKGDNVICDNCVSLIEEAKDRLSNPDMVRQVRERADAFCTYLQVVHLEKECRQAVDDYIDSALNIVKEIDPREYCASIHACPNRPPKAAVPKVQLPTLADFNNFGIETAVQIGPKPSGGVTSNEQMSSPQCTVCKTLVKEMFHFLRENKTEANIIRAGDIVCAKLYQSKDKLEQCQSMVKAYTRELVELLVDETDPEIICMLLEQCAYKKPEETLAPSQPFDLTQLITALDPSVPLGSLRSCVECKMFIKYLKDRLEDHQSQAMIKQWLLDNLCRELPEQNLIKSCSALIEEYSEVFFKAIVGDLNPEAACIELGVCNPKKRTVLNLINSNTKVNQAAQSRPADAKQAVVMRDRSCNGCMSVVSLIDDYLASNPSSDEIGKVRAVCNTISNRSEKSECVSILDQHGADIVQLIPSMESPRYLCKQITLC